MFPSLNLWKGRRCAGCFPEVVGREVVEPESLELRFLVAFDVDFATVIELADSTYQSPSRAQGESRKNNWGKYWVGKMLTVDTCE